MGEHDAIKECGEHDAIKEWGNMMQYRSGGTWCNKGVGEHEAIKE